MAMNARLCGGVVRGALPWLLFVLLLAAPVQGQIAAGPSAAQIREAVYYSATPRKTADEYTRERCVLDLYLPAKVTGFPTVVWFHEGDLESGERAIPKVFRNRGLAVAAPDYRLSPKATCEQAIADAAQAVAYVLWHIEALGGDPTRVFVAGSGAGGYLAGLVVLDTSLLAQCGVKDAKLAGLVSINGTASTHPTVLKQRGGEFVGRIVADTLSPMHHIRRDAPPILLVTADRRLEKSELYESNVYM